MRLYKETIEQICSTEEEAKNLIEEYRTQARQKGYTIGSAGYTYKTKKAKGEIVGELWVTKIVQIFGELWEDFELEY